jgi:hypothetical protein
MTVANQFAVGLNWDAEFLDLTCQFQCFCYIFPSLTNVVAKPS